MPTKHRPEMALNVERRAQEQKPSALLAENRTPGKRHVSTRLHHAALTRRVSTH